LPKIGSNWQAFEIGIGLGIEIGCSTARIDPDFDKWT